MVYKPKTNEYTLPRGNFIKRLSKQFEEISNKLNKKVLFKTSADFYFLNIP
jgi:hypothetical protein